MNWRDSIYNPREFRGRRAPVTHRSDGRRSWVRAGLFWIGLGAAVFGSITLYKREHAAELRFPKNAEAIYYQQDANRAIEFKVIGGTQNCMVKLENWDTGAPLMAVFVQAHSEATTKVPAGKYRTKMACGSRWYGTTRLFGPETVVSTGVRPLLFTVLTDRNGAETLNGHILNLHQKFDGNFHTNPGSRGAF